MEVTAQTRLLYVITKSNWGGAQRYVYDMATAAQAAGYDVLVAAGGNGELIERLKEASVPVHSITSLTRDINIDAEVAAFFELLSLYRKFRPTIVHLNSSKAGLAALAARFAGVRHILFTIHGWAWNEDRPGWQKAIIWCVYWITLLLCNRAIAVSETARQQARSLPFVQKRISVIHNGVHPVAFLSREEARRNLLPQSDKQFWIGTIAELHPVKGLPFLIEAFEHVAPDVPDSELVIIGEGQERPALERLMQIEGVSDSSNLVGHIPDAARYLKAFDIFVLPSRSESLAYVLLEAGMAGLPVVASRVGGIPEIIENMSTGLLVPYGDREGLTNALLSLSRNKELRCTYGDTLKKKVEREFTLDQMVEKTLALYEKNS